MNDLINTKGVQPTPEEELAQAVAELAWKERLPRTQKLASDWQAVIGAVTGLFGVGSIIAAPEAIRAVTSGWAKAASICAVLGLVFFAVSVVLASVAAQPRGSSKVSRDLTKLTAWYEDSIEHARCLLKWSRWTAALAAALMVAFLLMIFLADAVPKTPGGAA